MHLPLEYLFIYDIIVMSYRPVTPLCRNEVIMKNKHLSFEERLVIEEGLNKGNSVNSIAKKLDRPASSVSREIKRNRHVSSNELKSRIPCVHINSGDCGMRNACGDMKCYRPCTMCLDGCDMNCSRYIPMECSRLQKSPFVCNGCDQCDSKTMSRCRRYKYSAKTAQLSYEATLTQSRDGISLPPAEMEALDNLVSPLLLQGQSVSVIYLNHKEEIPCSISTLYDYVDKGYLTAKNIDLARKVRYKKRYCHGKKRKDFQKFVIGRKYIDFEEYIRDNPDLNIWEMDTVIGTPGGKSLLTLLFRKSLIMFAILLNEHTQAAVIDALNDICEAIGIAQFQKIFEIIVTDRGVEFGNPEALECDRNGEIKTRVFYCDPYCSWQKGRIEKNHEFIRMVLPKGTSFDNLTQDDIDLMMDHINSYPRKQNNGITPYALSELFLGKDFLQATGCHLIPPDEVILRPALLKRA